MVFLSLCVNPLPAIMCSTIALLCQALFPHLNSFCSSRLSHYGRFCLRFTAYHNRTAYLGDMELSEAVTAGQFKAGQLAEAKNKSKAVIKGARLKLYPPSFNLYRCSRGVKRPEVCETTEQVA